MSRYKILTFRKIIILKSILFCEFILFYGLIVILVLFSFLTIILKILAGDEITLEHFFGWGLNFTVILFSMIGVCGVLLTFFDIIFNKKRFEKFKLFSLLISFLVGFYVSFIFISEKGLISLYLMAGALFSLQLFIQVLMSLIERRMLKSHLLHDTF